MQTAVAVSIVCGRHRRPGRRRQLRDRAADRRSVARGRARCRRPSPDLLGLLCPSVGRSRPSDGRRSGARLLRGLRRGVLPSCHGVRRSMPPARRRRRSRCSTLRCSTNASRLQHRRDARDHTPRFPPVRSGPDAERPISGSPGINPDFRPASHASAPRHAPGGSRGSRRRRHGAAAPAGGRPTPVGLRARSSGGVRRRAVGDRSDPPDSLRARASASAACARRIGRQATDRSPLTGGRPGLTFPSRQ